MGLLGETLWGMPLVLVLAAVLLVLVAIWIGLRRRGSIEGQLRAVSRDLLTSFVIPDGNGGEIHVDYALLTPAGVVVLEIKDVEGHVFGSDSMDDWTVISQRRRFTFGNPQPALYDRVAAVKRLLPEVPVKGFLAFTGRARFTKGRPANVVMLEQLLDDLRRLARQRGAKSVEGLRPHWDRLRHEAVSAQVGHLMRD